MLNPDDELMDDLNLTESVCNASDWRPIERHYGRHDLTESVYLASDDSKERHDPTTEYMLSDNIGGVTATLPSHQCSDPGTGVSELASNSEIAADYRCAPCTKTFSSGNTIEGNWYCQQCKQVLCQACKSFHDVFKATENHVVIMLHPPCEPCKKKDSSSSSVAVWYCNECEEFLCISCRRFHLKLTTTAMHSCWSSYKKITEQRLAPLSKCRARYLTQFATRIPGDKNKPNIIDFALLPDSKLLLADIHNINLKLFDDNFQLITERFVEKVPRRLSTYDGTEFAVTTRERCILLFSMDNEYNIILKETLKLNIDCCGIAYLSKNRFAVTAFNPGSYHVYDTTGKEINRIVTDALGDKLFGDYPCNIAIDNLRFRAYVSDRGTVIAIDTNTHRKLFEYHHPDLTLASGLTVDQEGNIYVCGTSDKNIHQIFPDGQNLMILRYEKYSPLSLKFKSNDDKLFVGFCDGFMKIFKMDLSDENEGANARCTLS